MRTLSALALIVLGLALSGCGDYRESMMAVPDRQGHAARDPNTPAGTGLATSAVAGKNEMYITMGAQDSLSSIAKAYGVTLDWLIRRNRLQVAPSAGTNLVVPKR